MNTSGDGRAEEGSRRDSFGGLPKELSQELVYQPEKMKPVLFCLVYFY